VVKLIANSETTPIEDIRAFTQHGFLKQGESGNQIHGKCPFCGKDKHFFIKKGNTLWDCKSCGRAGGFQMFISQIASHMQQYFKGKIASDLADERGIPVEIFKKHKMGFNPNTNQYTLPIFYQDGTGKVLDVRHCTLGQPLHSTTSCSLGMLGWETIAAAEIVWICEGEWDCMAAQAGIIKMSEKEIAVSVPGANTFKSEWVALFRDKSVYACYDNDDAGQHGALKVFNLLRPIVKNIKFVNWPKTAEDGWDVRDEWKEKRSFARESLLKLMKPYPAEANTEEIKTAAIGTGSSSYTGQGMLPETLYDHFQKWLYLPDTIVLDVIFGTTIAHRLPGDPLWMFIVAPPGGTKTEPLLSLTGAPNVVCKSTLSSKGLVSGQKANAGIEPSLLPRLHGRVLIVKDFTTILTMAQYERDEIIGILRDAFDGKFERDWGNAKLVSWLTHFGFIAGVTPAIEQFMGGGTAFGERFISYTMPLEDSIHGRRPYLKRAGQNSGKEVEMKAELQKAASAVLNYEFKFHIKINEEVEDRIIDMAQFTSIMRGAVTRDRYSKEVTHSAYSELGTRLVKQYTKLIMGITAFHRETKPTERALEACRRICIGSVPTERRKVIRCLHEANKAMSVKEVGEAVGLPASPTCERVLQDLLLLGAVKKELVKGFGVRYTWAIKDDFAKTIKDGKIFQPNNGGE
jgi:ribosomal protein L37AE/L43A